MVKKKQNRKPMPVSNPKKIPTPVYNQILVQPVRRGFNDIGSWKSALRAADMGLRHLLYDLYTDILIDGTVTDAIGKRIEAITDADINFTVNKKEVPVITELMDTVEFENQLKDIMWTLFWGISVDEYSFENGFNFNSIPRKHIRPKDKVILRQQNDTTGISYENDDMVIQWGDDDDLGLLLKIAPYVIYKRGGFGDWAQFVELFGMPQRIGKYNSMDEQSRRLLIQAFETAGAAPYLVIPKESEVETSTLSGSANGALYNDFRNACNEEILITILGQTMTTKDGASLSQSKVHMEVQEKKHRADRRYVVRMLNKYLVPLLERRGYPVHGGKFSFVDKKDEITVTDLKTLSTMIPIPQSYGYEKYGIPEPKEGEPVFLSTPSGQEPEVEPGNPKPQVQKGNNPVKNSDEEEGFWKRLCNFFVEAPRSGGAGTIRMSDTASLEEKLIAGVWNGELDYFSPELFWYFSQDLLNAIRGTFKKEIKNADLRISYDAPDDVFRTAMETNLFHFSAAKTLAEIQELNRLFRESKDFEEFHRKAKEVTDVFNKTWQKTEYDTALLTAEAASNYRRLMKQADLFPYWQYHTAGDDKVRPKHRLLEGIILHHSDPRWKKIFPPNDWRCRCYVSALMEFEVEEKGVKKSEMQSRVDSFFEDPEWKKAEAQGWGVNRCETAEVFDANQMYIHKFPGQASRKMGEMTADKWGQETVPKLIDKAEKYIPTTADTEQTVWEQYSKDDVITLPDYEGRQIIVEKKQFESHTTKKGRDNRILYWAAMLETLENPDEVWINDESRKNIFDTYNLMRYYKDGVIVANFRVENGRLLLKTWYEMQTKVPEGRKISLKKIWDKRRRGLLIKKR